MLYILLASQTKENLSDMASALTEHKEVELSWAESGDKALQLAKESNIDLAITDEDLGDMTGLGLAGKLLMVNPMINCAAVSSLSPEEFHEASEGLGLLGQLSSKPDKKQAEELLGRLKDIKKLTSGVDIG